MKTALNIFLSLAFLFTPLTPLPAARLFSSARISAGSVPGNVGNDARTVCFWFRSSSVSTRQTLYYEGSAGGLITVEIDGSTLWVILFPVGGNTQGSTTLANDTWYHFTMIYDGAGSLRGYLNGVLEHQLTTGVIATTSTNFSFGGHPAGVQYLVGQMCEVARYNTWLDNGLEEISGLAKGFSPANVQPYDLAFYAPLIREVQDLKGTALTDNGPTSIADHPRIYK